MRRTLSIPPCPSIHKPRLSPKAKEDSWKDRPRVPPYNLITCQQFEKQRALQDLQVLSARYSQKWITVKHLDKLRHFATAQQSRATLLASTASVHSNIPKASGTRRRQALLNTEVFAFPFAFEALVRQIAPQPHTEKDNVEGGPETEAPMDALSAILGKDFQKMKYVID